MSTPTNPAMQIATEAHDKVVQVGAPIIVLAVALLVLSITILVIAYISSRLDQSSSK